VFVFAFSCACVYASICHWYFLTFPCALFISQMRRQTLETYSVSIYMPLIICRVGQNHIYTVYIRYFWQGNHQMYIYIRWIYIRFWPTQIICHALTLPRPLWALFVLHGSRPIPYICTEYILFLTRRLHTYSHTRCIHTGIHINIHTGIQIYIYRFATPTRVLRVGQALPVRCTPKKIISKT